MSGEVRTRRATRSALATGAVTAGAGAMLIVAWWRVWRELGQPDVFFGGDLLAYTSAATRLVETSTPYHARVLSGPVENIVANVPVGYFYPPPLAQLFIPVRDVDLAVLAWAWFAVQAALVVVLTPVVWRHGGGVGTPRAAACLGFLLVSSLPLAMALFGGNVSGWIAIGIAVMLGGGARGAGVAAALAAVVKSTPAPLLLAALLDRTARLPAALAAAGVAGVSLALAPQAWLDWLRAVPNIARNPPAPGAANLSPAAAGAVLGWPEAGAAVGIVLGVSFGLAACVLAWRQGLTLPVVAAAVYAYLFASPTLWDHQAAAVIPLIVAAWPRGSRPVRLAILAYILWGVTEWTALRPPLAGSAVTLVLLTLLGVALVARPLAASLRTLRASPPAG